MNIAHLAASKDYRLTAKCIDELDRIAGNEGSHFTEASMITVSGEGMHGAPGTAAKVLRKLGENDANVLMVSESSSEAKISLVIARSNYKKAMTAPRGLLLKGSLFKEITSEADVSLVAGVGAGMKGTQVLPQDCFEPRLTTV